MTRQTNIVATIGPSSRSPEILRKLIEAGMDIARLNFSHGTHEEHRATAQLIREVAVDLNKNVAILLDLQGPKIRTGSLEADEPILLVAGEPICITTEPVSGTAECISTTYAGLPGDVGPDDLIFVADGTLQFVVERVEPPKVFCRIDHGGYLGEHKGINLPGVPVSAPALTDRDIKDLQAGFTMEIDFIALSFVRTAQDIRELRRHIESQERPLTIIAKIERPEAVENFSEILEATDAVMLARGDLGVEVPLHEVPLIQKRLVFQCNELGVPVITATQMLESMTSSVRPTRAEVADVANAIYDGTDAVMLSGETASGQYPVEAVRVMASIALETDRAMAQSPTHERIVRMRESGVRHGRGGFGDAIGQAACRTASTVGAVCIVSFTKMGYTAGLIARYRPSVPIYAITLNEGAARRCALIWGVQHLASIKPLPTDELGATVDALLLDRGLAKRGDCVVIAGGMPLAMKTRTNMLQIHIVGEEFDPV